MSKYIYTKRSGKRTLVDDWFSLPDGYFLSVTDHGYAIVQRYIPESRGYEREYVHRLVLDSPEGSVVDHINGDKLDNRKENLRVCTQSENGKNQKAQIGRRYKGVSFDKRRGLWRSYIVVNGSQRHLGYWNTEEEAAMAYNIGAIEYHQSFARLNDVR